MNCLAGTIDPANDWRCAACDELFMWPIAWTTAFAACTAFEISAARAEVGAPWSCELNAGARSPWDLLRAGACAWWLSCCLAIRLLGCSPGASLAFCSTQHRWASWSTLGAKRCPFSGLGDRTPYAPRRRGGPTRVLHREGCRPHHQKLFSCGFLWHALLNRCRPDLGTLKSMCHRLIKRWDENTLLNK